MQHDDQSQPPEGREPRPRLSPVWRRRTSCRTSTYRPVHRPSLAKQGDL